MTPSLKLLQEFLGRLDEFEPDDLKSLITAAQSVHRVKTASKDSVELSGLAEEDDFEVDPLALRARTVLETPEDELPHKPTLADLSLLSCLVVTGEYGLDVFTSRKINDVIAECGRPRIVHITSVVNPQLDEGLLEGQTKALRFPAKGYRRAKALVDLLERKIEAA